MVEKRSNRKVVFFGVLAGLVLGLSFFVRSAVEDRTWSNAALWVGSSEGLFKYRVADGTLVWKTRADDRPVRAVAVDDRRLRVWGLTEAALLAFGFDGTREAAVALDDTCDGSGDGCGIPAHRALVVDPGDGGPWLVLGKTLLRFDAQGQLQAKVSLKQPVQGLAFDEERGVLWAATAGSLAGYDPDGRQVRTVSVPKHAEIREIAWDPVADDLCVALRNVVRCYDQWGAVVKEFPFDRADRILPDGLGGLWLAAGKKLARTDALGQVLFQMEPSVRPSPGQIVDLALDPADSGVWVSGSKGLFRVSPAGEVDGSIRELPRGRLFAVELYRDGIPPEVAVVAPAKGSFLRDPTPTVRVSCSDPGSGVDFDTLRILVDGLFRVSSCRWESDTAECVVGEPLEDGTHELQAAVGDREGNVGRSPLVGITIDTVPPGAVVVGRITVTPGDDGEVTIVGEAGSVEGGALIQVTNLALEQTLLVRANADGSFVLKIRGRVGDLLVIKVLDDAGNSSEAVQVKVPNPLPPAAESIPGASYGGIYRDLVPRDATLEAYDPGRFSLITGTVRNASGEALAGVTATVLGQPQYGSAQTDGEGRFTLPVDGGGTMTVVFRKDGLLTVHRQVAVPWNDIAVVEPPWMTALDPVATTVRFDGDPERVSLHRSSVVSDDRGSRTASLVFTGDNRAWRLDGDGNAVEELTTVTVRATEYPVPESMPAKLPPTSAYTYCVELSVDEADSVHFQKPVSLWVPNFLGFPVGMAVPVGFYDRSRGVWVPEPNGRVVRLLDTDGDGAVDALDADGDGQADDLDGSGFTHDEAKGLGEAEGFRPGDTFWRVAVSHFTPWDLNWAYWIISRYTPLTPHLPQGALSPNPSADPTSDMQRSEENDCYQQTNSYVSHRSRIFHEDIPIPGTDLTLHYASNRVDGYSDSITIPVSGETVPESLKRIVVEMSLAGRTYDKTLDPLPGQSVVFIWDGLDHLGRRTGSANASIRIGFVYDGVYTVPPDLTEAFAMLGQDLTSVLTRQEITVWKESTLAVTRLRDSDSNALAKGWTVSNHHVLDSARSILHKGDGMVLQDRTDHYGKRSVFYAGLIETVAGSGSTGSGGDGGPAVEAPLIFPYGLVADAAGGFYFTEPSACRVRRVDPGGVITTVAGNGSCGFNGDGRPAVETALNSPTHLAVDSQGSLYISDSGNYRIRKVDPNGVMTTVAGSGMCPDWWWGRGSQARHRVGIVSGEWPCFAGDNGPASEAKLNYPLGLALDPYGTLYIADSSNYRLRKVSPGGIITTIAGIGENCSHGDGGMAVEACLAPVDVFADSKGNVYVADSGHQRGRIRKIDPGGSITTVAGGGEENYGANGVPATDVRMGEIMGLTVDPGGNIYMVDESCHCIRAVNSKGFIATVAGTGSGGYGGDGGLSTQARLRGPTDVTLDPDGNLLIADHANHRIRRVGPRSFSRVEMKRINGDVYVDDSGLGYVLSSSGLHEKTVALDLAAVVRFFGYDSENRLVSITDRFGNTTTIVRNAGGRPIGIVSPDGLTTTLSIDSQNHLTAVTHPDGAVYGFTYTPGGLMTMKTEPRGNGFTHSFDALGRLSAVGDGAGGRWEYSKQVVGTDRERVEVVSGEGDLTVYVDQTAADGNYTSIITGPAGAQTRYRQSADGLRVEKSLPCGMEVFIQYGMDTEFKNLFVERLVERTPSGLEKVTERGRTYLDVNGDKIFDAIRDTVSVNGKTITGVTEVVGGERTVTSPGGRTVKLTYDTVDLLPNRMTVAGFHEKRFNYDVRGRLTSVAAGTRRIRFTYDGFGNVASMTDAEGRTTTYDHDAVGRLTGFTRPDGTSVAFAYDRNGNLELLTNPAGVDHRFGHNEVNLANAYEAPLSGGYRYGYDRDRRLTQVLAPSGKVVRNVYEGGRLARIETPEGEIELGYHCGDKLGSVKKGPEEIAYRYDGSLLVEERLGGSVNGALLYTYNRDFRLAGLSYAGEAVSYDHDLDGLLTRSGRFSILRNAANGLPEKVTDGVMEFHRVFNGHGECDGEAFAVGGAEVGSWGVGRDEAGRVRVKTETAGGETISETVYDYDSMGRLLSVVRDGVVVEEYRYGLNGVRIWERNLLRGIAGRSMTYSEEDQLLTAGGVEYEYDRDGFLVKKTRGSEVTRYSYSTRGELLSVRLPDGRLIEYVHDPLGRRIAKKADGAVVEKYLWQGMSRLLAVFDGEDNLRMRLDYADTRMPVRVFRNGEGIYLGYDHLGSLRFVTDAAGRLIKAIAYDSFGNVVGDSNPTLVMPIGFAGGLWDPDTGLLHFGFRDYDPDVGRWTAKDPILFAGGSLDLYGYVLNDPVNGLDPLGLWNSDVHSGIGNNIYGTYLWVMQSGLTDAAARIIANANNAVDWMPGTGWYPGIGDQSRHFDKSPCADEDTRASWADREFENALEAYRSGDVDSALKHLGRGLHSVQDYFAHREWDTGPLGISRHPSAYDVWDDPSNADVRQQTEAATKAYLNNFIKAVHW